MVEGFSVRDEMVKIMHPETILGYKLGELLGKGSFSEVYKAQKGNETVAIKLMNPPLGVSPEILMSSLRYEFWVLKDLSHPNIIQVIDFGQLTDGKIYIIEEFLNGQSLKEFCKERDFIECEPALLGALIALQELERWKITHGDVKSANIMVVKGAKGGIITKLLDFGLARSPNLSEIEKESSLEFEKSKDQSPVIKGTPSTMAPEVILGSSVDARSDLYSLGVCFYESLTGNNPFVSSKISETLQAQLKKIPEPIGLMREDIPPPWNQLIHRLLAKNPANRPGSAAQAMGMVRERKFVLTPSHFVGRERELTVIQEIEHALNTEKKMALCVEGKKGVGVSRFLREILYRLICKEPSLRDKMALIETNQTSNKPILLLDRTQPPQNYLIRKIELGPLNQEEVEKWLKSSLNIERIPTDFINNILRLTQGHPQHIGDLLEELASRGVLTDALSKVTYSTLDLVPWDEILPQDTEEEKLDDNFEWIYERAKQRVIKRNIKDNDTLWLHLERLVGRSTDSFERFRRRAMLLGLKGEALIDDGKLDLAKESLISALNLTQDEPKLKLDELKFRNSLAYILLRQGEPLKAVEEFESVRLEAQKIYGLEAEYKLSTLDLGFAYLHAKKYDQAIDRLREELKIHQRTYDRASTEEVSKSIQIRLVGCYYNLAQAHSAINSTDNAEQYYERGLKEARLLRDPTYILRCLNGLGIVLRNTDRWQIALNHFGKALEVALALNDYSAAAAAALNRGALRRQKEFYDKAYEDLNDSLTYLEKVSPKYAFEKTMVCRSHVELGETYIAQNRWEEAKEAIDRAWHMAEKDEDLKDFRFWVLGARCYLWVGLKDRAQLGRDLSALKYYAQDEGQRQTVKEFEKIYRNEETSKQVQGLNKELAAVLTMTRDLVGDMPLEELLKRILGHAIELTYSEFGVILLSGEDGKLKPALSLNADLDEDLQDISLSVANKVVSTGNIVKATDALEEANFNQYASVIALNLKSILGIPISFKGKILGVLYLSHRYRKNLFDERIIQTTQAFADQAGLALKNNELLEFYRKSQKELKNELEETKVELTVYKDQLMSLPEDLLMRINKGPIITQSSKMGEVLKQVDRIASSNLSVIIYGESGTGKELLARFIHESSSQKNKPFIAINCGALPSTLIESELFGHVKGAFTGADRDKVGLIEAASGGTLFLDEIADLPIDMQVKFLRVLQEKELTRVGDTKTRSVTIRVIAASHQALDKRVKEGRFREDLYYRLVGFEVHLPPLRDRMEDIPFLAEKFLEQYREENSKKNPTRIETSLIKLMTNYSWPGNVRELKNMVLVSASLADGALIRLEDLPRYIGDRLEGGKGGGVTGSENPQAGWYYSGRSWKEHELLIYGSALTALNYDVPRVATSLGVGVATVYKWLREHRIKEERDAWAKRALPYQEGLKLDDIRRNIFTQAINRHPGHPYYAAKELDVAPVTFYRWSQKN